MLVSNHEDGKCMLQSRCAYQIKEAIERQLKAMPLFDGIDENNEIKEKRKFTPLTNLGCESEFASV